MNNFKHTHGSLKLKAKVNSLHITACKCFLPPQTHGLWNANCAVLLMTEKDTQGTDTSKNHIAEGGCRDQGL